MTARRTGVLYFSNSTIRSGAEEHILTLLRRLDRSRFELGLACPPSLAREMKPDLPGDVAVFPVELSRVGHGRAALRLLNRLRRGVVDVLHSHLFYSSMFASPLGWLARVPVIVETPHCREQWRRGRLKSSFVVDRAAARFVDHYVAVSQANARYLIDEKRLPPEKVVVIENGCDVARFDPRRPPPEGLRERLGFGPRDPILMVVGRLEPQKGHAVLIDALPEIRRRFADVRVVCLGEGSLRQELEARARMLGVADAVAFPGRQPRIEEWLPLADLTVLPSFYEGLPLVALESLAAGRAVVATAVDGTPEIVVDGETGLTVPPGDPAALARAVCDLLADPARRQAMGRRGRDRVVSQFSEEKQTAATASFYLRAREGSRRGALAPRPVTTAAAEVPTPGSRAQRAAQP